MIALITQISTVTSESVTCISQALQAPRNILAAENKRSISQQMHRNNKTQAIQQLITKRNILLGKGSCSQLLQWTETNEELQKALFFK